MEPWIKLYRKFKEWEWYTDTNCKVVFLHLLLTANWHPKKWKGITINAGEVVTSVAKLSKEVNLTVQQTRTALDRLQASGAVNKQATSKYTLIKVLNYCVYQGFDVLDNKLINKQITSEQQTDNKQITTTKELKNNRNIYNNYIYYSEDFGEIVKAYEDNIGIISPTVAEILKDFTKDFGKDLILFAIEEAVKSNVRNIRYIEGILRTWKEKGVSSVEGARLATAEHRTKSAAMPKTGAGRAGTKKNFFQNYDSDELSDFELQLMRDRLSRSIEREDKEIAEED